MASPEKKSPSSRRKKYHLSEIDLARAATASASRRKNIIKQATGGEGYDRYKGVKTNLGPILNVALPLLVGAPKPTKEQIKTGIARSCNDGPGEVKGNQAVGLGLYDYVTEHKITAAAFDLGPVALGRAGKRCFWAPYILKINGKNYIPFFDFRGETRLPLEARRFVFSVNHTYIRLANPTEFGNVGFVIFQFEEINGRVRKVVPYFDDGISFWIDTEIGAMIDEVYRVLDEIRKAA
jgi:hypothetical protein